MGRSYIDFGGQGFWTRDGYAELWLYLICVEIEATPSAPLWLRHARERWYIEATAGIGGCISPMFDSHLTDDERVRVVLGLHDEARRRVESYGEVLPREVAEGIPWFSGNYPTAHLLTQFDLFDRLLRREYIVDDEPGPTLTQDEHDRIHRYVQQGKTLTEALALLQANGS
ncbi:hypothetical protein [Amycolatopsis taiwanensis]|uniref:Uncharacterized protein n=1 Tax=Amycolatopsis taiwanensis TaxID=342230 RepID=A0A9W6VDY7_9PSEU|nr:hypothetical protein [Amycolatopsis taiwanensis]GLY65225.1 hypothetical protein Atai01_18440 [Amycolatopsis taiwanensis]